MEKRWSVMWGLGLRLRARLLLVAKEFDQVIIHDRFETRNQRVDVGIPWNLGRIDQQFRAPYQAGLGTPFDHLLEALAEDGQTEALSDAGQARMARKWLVQGVPAIPADAEIIG